MRTVLAAIKRVLAQIDFELYRKPPFVRRKTEFPYEPPARPARVLSDDFFAIEKVHAHDREHVDQFDQPLAANAVYQAWRSVAGGHKWMHYFDAYQSALQLFGGRPIRMLEIGVYKGGSLAMWRKVLPPGSLLVGVDISPDCRQYEDAGNGVHVRIGDQSDAAFLAAVNREHGPFDFILDDGSHVVSHQIASFGALFLSALKDGGIYMVEDVHTNFWFGEGHRDSRYSFVDMSKDLVDYANACHWSGSTEPHFRLGHSDRVPTLSVPRLGAHIKEIRFQDSVVTIFKKCVVGTPISVHL